jgi:hypothetical protein
MDTIGGEVKTLTAFTPRAVSGEVLESGDVIDRKGHNSATFTIITGNYTGSPTSINVSCKVQECSTTTGTFSDVSGATTSISGEVTTLANIEKEVNVDLRSCERYIRLAVTPDFTGGTSPTFFMGATVTLGEPSIKPAV